MGDQSFPLERSWYIGNAFFAILYGLQISMFFQSVYYLSIGPGSRKSKTFYIGYSTVMLVLITFALACNQWFGEAMWIEHRDVEGGPAQFFADNIAAWYNTLGTSADVVANVLGDGLMLYRCYVFWEHVPLAMVLPSLLYLSSVAMGITMTIQSGLPGGDIFHGTTVNFGIPWVVLTIVFNILVTAMIAIRLLSMHSRANLVLGIDPTKRYTGLLAILVESALPFTLLGIVYLATYAKQIPESLALAGIWGAFVSLSPQAIILRVAMGAAFTREMVVRVSSGGGQSISGLIVERDVKRSSPSPV
ncbi:hypothetical protein B0H17DRAFT_1235718 [Mycena rosella]|uniref:Uncharacterized protein n=1 Tax=Mycena rosella TaxID=1033263 RepID=A0AAD7GB77_MYCRO|nr:hypothetical protein B0H17DRAFT_1235718 [Mycena rosella]